MQMGCHLDVCCFTNEKQAFLCFLLWWTRKKRRRRPELSSSGASAWVSDRNFSSNTDNQRSIVSVFQPIQVWTTWARNPCRKSPCRSWSVKGSQQPGHPCLVGKAGCLDVVWKMDHWTWVSLKKYVRFIDLVLKRKTCSVRFLSITIRIYQRCGCSEKLAQASQPSFNRSLATHMRK